MLGCRRREAAIRCRIRDDEPITWNYMTSRVEYIHPSRARTVCNLSTHEDRADFVRRSGVLVHHLKTEGLENFPSCFPSVNGTPAFHVRTVPR
jgi:chloramphenicol O-acetyltransferase